MSVEIVDRNEIELQQEEKENQEVEMEEYQEDQHRAITAIPTKYVNKEWNETKIIHGTLKVIKKTLEEWMKECEVAHIFDKHNEKMGTIENWAHEVRTTRRHERNNRKFNLFVKTGTSLNPNRLKQRVRDLCKEEKFGRA